MKYKIEITRSFYASTSRLVIYGDNFLIMSVPLFVMIISSNRPHYVGALVILLARAYSQKRVFRKSDYKYQ